MTNDIHWIEKAFADSLNAHYKQVSEELLYAYQRNKEAVRHHEAGAWKAALHHAKLSKHHTFNAHEHLKEVLQMVEKIQTTAPPMSAQGQGLSGRW